MPESMDDILRRRGVGAKGAAKDEILARRGVAGYAAKQPATPTPPSGPPAPAPVEQEVLDQLAGGRYAKPGVGWMDRDNARAELSGTRNPDAWTGEIRRDVPTEQAVEDRAYNNVNRDRGAEYEDDVRKRYMDLRLRGEDSKQAVGQGGKTPLEIDRENVPVAQMEDRLGREDAARRAVQMGPAAAVALSPMMGMNDLAEGVGGWVSGKRPAPQPLAAEVDEVVGRSGLGTKIASGIGRAAGQMALTAPVAGLAGGGVAGWTGAGALGAAAQAPEGQRVQAAVESTASMALTLGGTRVLQQFFKGPAWVRIPLAGGTAGTGAEVVIDTVTGREVSPEEFAEKASRNFVFSLNDIPAARRAEVYQNLRRGVDNRRADRAYTAAEQRAGMADPARPEAEAYREAMGAGAEQASDAAWLDEQAAGQRRVDDARARVPEMYNYGRAPIQAGRVVSDPLMGTREVPPGGEAPNPAPAGNESVSVRTDYGRAPAAPQPDVLGVVPGVGSLPVDPRSPGARGVRPVSPVAGYAAEQPAPVRDPLGVLPGEGSVDTAYPEAREGASVAADYAPPPTSKGMATNAKKRGKGMARPKAPKPMTQEEAGAVKAEYIQQGGDPTKVISEGRLRAAIETGKMPAPRTLPDGTIEAGYDKDAGKKGLIEEGAKPAVAAAEAAGVQVVSSGVDAQTGDGYAVGRAPGGQVVEVRAPSGAGRGDDPILGRLDPRTGKPVLSSNAEISSLLSDVLGQPERTDAASPAGIKAAALARRAAAGRPAPTQPAKPPTAGRPPVADVPARQDADADLPAYLRNVTPTAPKVKDPFGKGGGAKLNSGVDPVEAVRILVNGGKILAGDAKALAAWARKAGGAAGRKLAAALEAGDLGGAWASLSASERDHLRASAATANRQPRSGEAGAAINPLGLAGDAIKGGARAAEATAEGLAEIAGRGLGEYGPRLKGAAGGQGDIVLDDVRSGGEIHRSLMSEAQGFGAEIKAAEEAAQGAGYAARGREKVRLGGKGSGEKHAAQRDAQVLVPEKQGGKALKSRYTRMIEGTEQPKTAAEALIVKTHRDLLGKMWNWMAAKGWTRMRGDVEEPMQPVAEAKVKPYHANELGTEIASVGKGHAMWGDWVDAHAELNPSRTRAKVEEMLLEETAARGENTPDATISHMASEYARDLIRPDGIVSGGKQHYVQEVNPMRYIRGHAERSTLLMGMQQMFGRLGTSRLRKVLKDFEAQGPSAAQRSDLLAVLRLAHGMAPTADGPGYGLKTMQEGGLGKRAVQGYGYAAQGTRAGAMTAAPVVNLMEATFGTGGFTSGAARSTVNFLKGVADGAMRWAGGKGLGKVNDLESEGVINLPPRDYTTDASRTHVGNAIHGFSRGLVRIFSQPVETAQKKGAALSSTEAAKAEMDKYAKANTVRQEGMARMVAVRARTTLAEARAFLDQSMPQAEAQKFLARMTHKGVASTALDSILPWEKSWADHNKAVKGLFLFWRWFGERARDTGNVLRVGGQSLKQAARGVDESGKALSGKQRAAAAVGGPAMVARYAMFKAMEGAFTSALVAAISGNGDKEREKFTSDPSGYLLTHAWQNAVAGPMGQFIAKTFAGGSIGLNSLGPPRVVQSVKEWVEAPIDAVKQGSLSPLGEAAEKSFTGYRWLRQSKDTKEQRELEREDDRKPRRTGLGLGGLRGLGGLGGR